MIKTLFAAALLASNIGLDWFDAHFKTYDKMQKYIALLDESEKYQKEFAAVLVESRVYDASYAYVLKWFKDTFPSYGKQPERDANLKIVNTPANYSTQIVNN